MKNTHMQRIELILIRDHLERAHAIAKVGEHVVADEIQDAIDACNVQIMRCADEMKEMVLPDLSNEAFEKLRKATS